MPDNPTTPLTAAELDDFERLHSSTMRGGLGPVCGECEELVSCPSLRLVAMARRAEQLSEHVQRCDWCDQITSCEQAMAIFPMKSFWEDTDGD